MNKLPPILIFINIWCRCSHAYETASPILVLIEIPDITYTYTVPNCAYLLKISDRVNINPLYRPIVKRCGKYRAKVLLYWPSESVVYTCSKYDWFIIFSRTAQTVEVCKFFSISLYGTVMLLWKWKTCGHASANYNVL
jgi:hypothetical protein